jgi:hypothetical protein
MVDPIPSLTMAGPDAVPWYYPLEGDIMKAQTLWDSESVRFGSVREACSALVAPA